MLYSLPQNLESRLAQTTVPYFAIDNVPKQVEQFANTLNYFIYALAPLPVVGDVDDEYIRSCLTIAKKISDVENIDRAEFVRLFEDEISDLGYSMEDRNLDAFYDYFLANYQEE